MRRSINAGIVEKLTPGEQAIYFQLLPRQVVRIEDGERLIEKKDTARKIFVRLRRKGFAKRIQRGVYLLVPPEALGGEPAVDPFVLASRIPHGSYYLSHHTALAAHGIAHTMSSEVVVSVGTEHAPLRFQGSAYRFVSTKHLFGAMEIVSSGQTVAVSDLERTVIDCVRRPNLAGGLEEMLKSFSSLPRLNAERLLGYVAKIGEKSLYHRMGFLLETVQDRARNDAAGRERDYVLT